MLGEPSGEFKKLLHADDFGTRLQHMVELHDLWNTSYGILTRPDLYHTPLEEERAKQLSIALDLLQHHMEAEFNSTPYAKEINALSKPKNDPPAAGGSITTWRDTV